ncbi:hypothetical protein C8J57DRAFT_1554721 [Mycena rebaudengoi]|nr:hypothetical protein C8J57DRAFT_1554721 [Mycena rebaudengoi]
MIILDAGAIGPNSDISFNFRQSLGFLLQQKAVRGCYRTSTISPYLPTSPPFQHGRPHYHHHNDHHTRNLLKDLIEVGQSIKRSIEKVGENRRRIRELTDDVLSTLGELVNLSRGRENTFQAPELLDALGNLKADMLHVLSATQKISPPPHRSGFRGLQSQFKVWLEREDVEAEVKHLKKHVNKCYIQFTAYAAARIENNSVRVEQRLIINNVEHQARLRRLEGMMARILVQTQFGQNVVNQTMEIVASDPGHQTLESQYLSAQAMRLIDSLKKLLTTTNHFRSEHSGPPYWDAAEALRPVFLQPTSATHVLSKILAVVLQINDCPAQLSQKNTAEMMLNLGVELSALGMRSEATHSNALSVQVFRHLASGANFTGCLPRLTIALIHLSREYNNQLRYEPAVQASEQSVYWCHVFMENQPNIDNRGLLLLSLNAHSTSLRATGEFEAAISLAQEAVVICRALLAEIAQLASAQRDWTLWYPDYEFQANACSSTFFSLAHALSGAHRYCEAYLASKEGFEIVAWFSGTIPPPSGSDIDAFFDQICQMAEAGDLPQKFLADATILYCSLSGIFPKQFSTAFLLVLHARAYFSRQDHALPMKDLRLFLEPSWDSSLPVIDDFSACMPWLDDWMVGNAIRALFTSETAFYQFEVRVLLVHLVRTHVDLAVTAIQELVTPLVAEPDIDEYTGDITFQICHICAELPQQDALLILNVLDDLVAHYRKVFASSQTNWYPFEDMLWTYCRGLWEAGCLSNALAIAEEAVQYVPPNDTTSWHGLHTLILIDMDRVGEAQTVLCDPTKRLDSSDSHWRVKYLILLQTGRREQALSLLERSTLWDSTEVSHEGFRFHLSDLASAQLDVGQTQRALETAERAVAEFRELPRPPRIEVAYALCALSDCLAAVGRQEEGLTAAQEARQADDALQNAEKAVTEYRELVSRAVRHIPALANSLRNLTTRFWDAGRQDQSIAALGEAISLLRGVINTHSHLLPSLCDALEQLTEYLSERGETGASLAAATECAEIRGRLALSPVSLEPLLEIDAKTEANDASDCEEIISQDTVLAIAAQTDGEQVQQTVGVTTNLPEGTSIYEVSQAAANQQRDEVATEKTNATATHPRFEVKIELKSPPLDVVGWILLGALGIACAGLALALARK